MYYLIRIIFVVIIFSVCSLCLRKKKERLLIKSNRKKRIIIIVLSCLIIGIIFIPYEAPFIRFDSPEASVKYSTIKGNLPLYVVEGKNTAFTLQNSGNNYYYHAIIKHDDKYGFCDFHTQRNTGFNSTITDDEYFHGLVTVDTLLNGETNETCFFISFIKMKKMEADKTTISDADNTPIKPIFQNSDTIIFAFMPKQNDAAVFFYNGQPFSLN